MKIVEEADEKAQKESLKRQQEEMMQLQELMSNMEA